MTQLTLDLSDSDDAMIRLMAQQAVIDGDFSDYDHAYETLWDSFEFSLMKGFTL